jgi:hypothetical protein
MTDSIADPDAPIPDVSTWLTGHPAIDPVGPPDEPPANTVMSGGGWLSGPMIDPAVPVEPHLIVAAVEALRAFNPNITRAAAATILPHWGGFAGLLMKEASVVLQRIPERTRLSARVRRARRS